MTADCLFSAGRLSAAIKAQTDAVEANPTDAAARLFLFELFAFAGNLDRARWHLDQLRADPPGAVERFDGALSAEVRRRAVFAGTEWPAFAGAVPDHLLLRLEALPCLARAEHVEARRKLDAANAAGTPGALNGCPFAELCDADERFGTVLEVFDPDGAYRWVALEQVARIALDPLRAPRDALWRPARLALVGGPESDVLLPGLYPGTHEHTDDEVRLGRTTEWVGADGEVARGVGGRVFLAGSAVIRFADVTSLNRSA